MGSLFAGRRLGIRWTIGDVSEKGVEALRLSIAGAWLLFGKTAQYMVCVNTVAVDAVRAKLGDIPEPVRFRQCDASLMPPWLQVDRGMAEGVAWKFAPIRVFPSEYELSLDNDVIFWDVPAALSEWLRAGGQCLIAEDVRPGFGQFAHLCPVEPRNSGIRGIPPGFDLERALRRTYEEKPVVLRSELDEQGLQVAALSREPGTKIVSVREVSICSPFKPHIPHLGTHGVHFVGINSRRFGWCWDNLDAHVFVHQNFDRLRPEVEARLEALAEEADAA